MAAEKIAPLPYDCIALVLQGGGALGAYQAGVFEGLAEAGIEPHWVAGISIGAKRNGTAWPRTTSSAHSRCAITGPAAWPTCGARWRTATGWRCRKVAPRR
jgi:hypothetical protein